jgi:hypothetical protein
MSKADFMKFLGSVILIIAVMAVVNRVPVVGSFVRGD